MAEEKIPPGERIASSFKRLASSSTDLNTAADELSNTVSKLESALRELNLGISAWHRIAGSEDRDGTYWSRDIGYTGFGKEWHIALRKVSGDNFLDDHKEEIWRFAEAPRWMCVESISKLPDLLDELIKRTDETARKLKNRNLEATELTKAVVRARIELRHK